MSETPVDQNEIMDRKLDDTEGMLRALDRAGRHAFQLAIATGTPVVIGRNGHIEHADPHEQLAELDAKAGEDG